LRDNVDYVPTNRFILWGHHFTSVAGAAPIVGPAIAMIWGWLPAFLWVTIGTIFFAGMHDLGSLWASTRNRGQTIAALSARYIGKRGAALFLLVIFILGDRKSTRLNSSHVSISYAVFCLKKKK